MRDCSRPPLSPPAMPASPMLCDQRRCRCVAVPRPAGPVAGAAPAVVTVPPMSRSTPVRVQIPAIGVDSGLMDLGLRGDGAMQTPPTGFPAGWYTGGPTPGQLGPAVVVGHVDWAGHPGVFYDLRELKTGDQVIVGRTDARKVVFRVSRVEEFAKDAFPTHAVYGNVDHAALRLITCGGSFDQQAASYRDNIVAFADLVPRLPTFARLPTRRWGS